MIPANLLEGNKKLEVRAKVSEAGKMKNIMERAKLENELHNIQRQLTILRRYFETGATGTERKILYKKQSALRNIVP